MTNLPTPVHYDRAFLNDKGVAHYEISVTRRDSARQAFATIGDCGRQITLDFSFANEEERRAHAVDEAGKVDNGAGSAQQRHGEYRRKGVAMKADAETITVYRVYDGYGEAEVQSMELRCRPNSWRALGTVAAFGFGTFFRANQVDKMPRTPVDAWREYAVSEGQAAEEAARQADKHRERAVYARVQIASLEENS